MRSYIGFETSRKYSETPVRSGLVCFDVLQLPTEKAKEDAETRVGAEQKGASKGGFHHPLLLVPQPGAYVLVTL